MGRFYELDWLMKNVQMNEKNNCVDTLKQKGCNVLWMLVCKIERV